MASIKNRVSGLELLKKSTSYRQLTDAERAVRLTYILNNQKYAHLHAPLREFLKRVTGHAVQPKGDKQIQQEG